MGIFSDSKAMRALICILLGAVGLLGVSACDRPSQGDETATAVTQKETINIGRLICGGHLPLAIVEKRYQDRLTTFGLRTVQNHDWNDVIADMQSGKLAGTFILSPLAMNLIREGFPGKIVLMADRNGNGFVLSRKIKSISALRNRKSIIAVPHIFSQHHVLLHRVLQQYGVPEGQVVVLGMPPRDMINSLKRGEIDGFVVGEPEGNKSISLGVGWMAAISPAIWKDHMDHVFLVSDEFIREEPEKLQELIDQLVRGAQFIEEHPHEAAVMGEDYTGSSAKVFEQVLTTRPDWISYKNTVARTDDMTVMAQQLVEMGLWPDVPDDLDGGYFDMRFARKAEARIRGQ